MSFVVVGRNKVKGRGEDRGSSPYLERHAKTYITSKKLNIRASLRVVGGGENYCGRYAKVGRCKGCGSQYLKVIYCGKEWCENCREITHNRRIARWLPKAFTMQSFGYFVFTIPLEMREYYQDKKHLSELRTYLRRRLKQIYPDIRALVRWHWFGDSPYLYHPHLNIMVSSFERLSEKELERIKHDYKKALERFTGIKLDKKIDVYYHYYSPEGFKREAEQKRKKLTGQEAQELYQKALWHKLRYITRPTFTVYNRELAEKLKNYRNSVVWGRFPELSYEEVEELAKQREVHTNISQDLILLKSGCCPICGGKIRWLKGLYPGSLSSYGEEVGAGYYRLLIEIRGSPIMDWEKLRKGLMWRKLRLAEESESIKNWLDKEQRRKDIYD